jgi:hypothetical protein
MKKNIILREVARGLASIALALSSGFFTPVRAQETLTPLTPAGRLRVGVSPVFSSWSSRFGEDGSEPLGVDLTDPTGARLFPGIATLEERLRDLLRDSGYRAWLGSTRAEISASRVRVPLEAELGVFDWLSVGVTVPLVQNRTEVEFSFRADSATANLGVNPAITRTGEVLAFSDELRQRLGAAAARADAVCAAMPSSTECASARQLAQDGQRLVSGFRSVYSASPFFLLDDSQGAATLRQQVTTFNQGLTAQGLTPVSRAPLFADARLSTTDLEELLLEPAAGILSDPLGNRVNAWELGDVEAHATLRLLESRSGATLAEPPNVSYQLGVGALLRLGTGEVDDPNVFLDLGAGDGQTDLEARVFGNLRVGSVGLWGEARYGMQRPRTVIRRVGPPDLVLIPLVNLASVEWSPGDYLELQLAPRGHLSPELAVSASYRLFHKGQDTFTRLSALPPAPDTTPVPSPPIFPDVDVLATGTEQTLHEAGVGLLYSTLAPARSGRASIPLEGHLEARWPFAGKGLSAPRAIWASAGVRVFFSLWGD